MHLIYALGAVYAFVLISIFFDQARLTRRNTFYRLTSTPPKVALTFDDGPDPTWTPQILDVLNRHGVKATFFVVGERVRRHPEIVRAMIDGGHVVGNHTYRHRPLWRLSKRAVVEEIRKTEDEIVAACGKKPTLFRPPKGLLWSRQKGWVAEIGYDVVLWSVNTKDWAGISARGLVSSLTRRARGGDILLFHDGGGVVATRGGNRAETVSALEPLIAAFKERGLDFVSLDRSVLSPA